MTDHEKEPLADQVPAACLRLGLSRTMLYREIAAGRLRAVKVHSRTLITREDQAAWLKRLPAMASKAMPTGDAA